ncbi:MAG: hypothetical protein JXA10_17955, partial [Anaerolineae bacterium]|nr:hypothetical protein [Anaerolineae bacterium]
MSEADWLFAGDAIQWAWLDAIPVEYVQRGGSGKRSVGRIQRGYLKFADNHLIIKDVDRLQPPIQVSIAQETVHWYSLHRAETDEAKVSLTLHCADDDDIWTIHTLSLTQAALTDFYRIVTQVDPDAPLARYPD